MPRNSRNRVLLQDGRPYVSWSPPKLGQYLGSFVDLSDEIVGILGPKADISPWSAEVLSSALELGRDMKSRPSQQVQLGEHVRRIVAKKDVTVGDLITLNAKVLQLPVRSFRSGAMWVGSEHPADSTFVAPPPSSVGPLMKDLVYTINDRSLHPLVAGCVALNQMLLIHPFANGNGRTARAVFAAFAVKSGMSVTWIAKFISRIWMHEAMLLHGAQLNIRSTDDWGPYLQLVKCTVLDMRDQV